MTHEEKNDHARGVKWGNSQADLPRRNSGDNSPHD